MTASSMYASTPSLYLDRYSLTIKIQRWADIWPTIAVQLCTLKSHSWFSFICLNNFQQQPHIAVTYAKFYSVSATKKSLHKKNCRTHSQRLIILLLHKSTIWNFVSFKTIKVSDSNVCIVSLHYPELEPQTTHYMACYKKGKNKNFVLHIMIFVKVYAMQTYNLCWLHSGRSLNHNLTTVSAMDQDTNQIHAHCLP